MRLRDTRALAVRRGGFTLIELLVVMAIIAVLVGLLMSGVMAALAARDRTANKFDIGKLDQSMSVALQDYGKQKTLPGSLVLYNNTDVYRNVGNYFAAGTPDYKDAERSRDALRRMFGERFITTPNKDSMGNHLGVNWDGSGNYGNPTGKVVGPKTTLEGHQCLVFYLGGSADLSGSVPKMRGFSKNPLDPLDFSPTGTKERYGPYYEFESKRLTTDPLFGAANSMGSGLKSITKYPAYNDRYGVPFAYFGGTGGSNTYVGGCLTLGLPSAFADGTAGNKFMKPDKFQIVSAGRDKTFGNQAQWSSAVGNADTKARDDVSNFSSVPLSNPPE